MSLHIYIQIILLGTIFLDTKYFFSPKMCVSVRYMCRDASLHTGTGFYKMCYGFKNLDSTLFHNHYNNLGSLALIYSPKSKVSVYPANTSR